MIDRYTIPKELYGGNRDLTVEEHYEWTWRSKTMMDMHMSEAGIASTKESEGFVAHVYNDNGADAIGYGHRLLPGESFPNGLTMQEGDALLRKDYAERYEPILNARIPSNCTQGQFDALGDFCYNVRNQPTSLDELMSHGWDQIAAQLPRWDHEKKNDVEVENPGLKARRMKEVALFNS